MKHEVGPAADFPLGECRIVEVAGREIGIFNVDQAYYAVLNVCPHHHAPVCAGFVAGTYLPSAPGERVFGMAGRVLSCPWHFWEFDIVTGESVYGVDHRKLKTFPVTVTEDDRLLVEIGRP